MDYKLFVLKKYPEAISKKMIINKKIFWIIKTNKRTDKYISQGECENIAWKKVFETTIIN